MHSDGIRISEQREGMDQGSCGLSLIRGDKKNCFEG